MITSGAFDFLLRPHKLSAGPAEHQKVNKEETLNALDWLSYHSTDVSAPHPDAFEIELESSLAALGGPDSAESAALQSITTSDSFTPADFGLFTQYRSNANNTQPKILPDAAKARERQEQHRVEEERLKRHRREAAAAAIGASRSGPSGSNSNGTNNTARITIETAASAPHGRKPSVAVVENPSTVKKHPPAATTTFTPSTWSPAGPSTANTASSLTFTAATSAKRKPSDASAARKRKKKDHPNKVAIPEPVHMYSNNRHRTQLLSTPLPTSTPPASQPKAFPPPHLFEGGPGQARSLTSVGIVPPTLRRDQSQQQSSSSLRAKYLDIPMTYGSNVEQQRVRPSSNLPIGTEEHQPVMNIVPATPVSEGGVGGAGQLPFQQMLASLNRQRAQGAGESFHITPPHFDRSKSLRPVLHPSSTSSGNGINGVALTSSQGQSQQQQPGVIRFPNIFDDGLGPVALVPATPVSEGGVGGAGQLPFQQMLANLNMQRAQDAGQYQQQQPGVIRFPNIFDDGLPSITSFATKLGESKGSTVFVSANTASLAPTADVATLITWISPMPVKVNGHFCDVFEGTHSTVGKVALKRPRIGTAGFNEDIIRRFQREAATWEKLRHRHILEYLGSFQRDGHFYFVSPFIEDGTLIEYIALYPNVNRIKLLCETADAINYLHHGEVVHGDIKANNLLISNNGQVLLCDFGLTRTVHLSTSTAMKGAGTLRWQSPELWDAGSKSFKSDVYAFGMTIAEVLTGDVPFPDLQTDGAVIRAVLIEGRRPPKNPSASSAGLSYEKVWAVAEACWSEVPEERISMSEALQRIQEDLAAMQKI